MRGRLLVALGALAAAGALVLVLARSGPPPALPEGHLVAYEYPDLWASPPAKAHVLAGRETTVDFIVAVPAEIPAAPDIYTPHR